MRSITATAPLFLCALMVGCLGEDLSEPGTEAAPVLQSEAIARDVVAKAGWVFEGDSAFRAAPVIAEQSVSIPAIFDFRRDVVADDVAHYSFKVKVDAGQFDVIGVHRVVREVAPYRPLVTGQSVFLDHGDYNHFVVAFMSGVASPNLPDDQGLAVYLARNGIDVWGIDHGWALVPGETSDFSFMKDWGIMKDVAHLRVALDISRTVRRLTGNGNEKLTLLGWSTGAVRTFAYADQESQLPPGARHVKAIIPVDMYLRTDDPELVGINCAEAGNYAAEIAQGVYEDDTGWLAQMIGSLAAWDPDGFAPYFPDFTNAQFAVLFAAATYWITMPMAPCFHFVAGTFDQYGLPSGLRYMSLGAWLDYLMGFAPWMPNRILLEEYAVACPEMEVAFDDHLGDVTVPVLWIGAGGGYGDTMQYMMGMLGSSDVTGLVASVDPDRCLDYGHIDLFWGDNAQTLVWEPILNWVRQH